MNSLLDLQNIVLILGIMGVLFGVHRYFRDPDVQAEKSDAILSYRLTTVEKQMSNDIPHINAKIDLLRENVSLLRDEVIKIRTVIEERMPRK